MVDGVDYTAGDFQTANLTPLKHGTAVAGIIGALRNNTSGIGGIAGGDVSQGNTGVQLLSFGIFSASGIILNQQGYVDWATLAESVVEGSSQTTNNYGFGLHIQNHSWGSYIPGTGDFQEAFEIAFKNHCIVVAARGYDVNSANEANWPACDDDKMVISVMASGTDGERKVAGVNGEGSWSSGYGLSGQNNSIACLVDLMAPGANELVGTLASSNGTPYNYNICNINDPLYTCFSGTSAAAPHVSGVAALMCSHHNTVNGFSNNLVTEDIEAVMEKTASNNQVYDLNSGWGLVNAYTAVEQVSDPYCVKHMNYDYNDAVATHTQTISNVNVWGAAEMGIPNGTSFVEAKKYEVVWNINETLNQGDQIIDWWDLVSSRDLGKNGINSGNGAVLSGTGGYVNATLNIPIEGNTVNGSATTYVYALKQTPTSSVFWYPINPNNLRFAYSLHIIKAPTGIDEIQSDEFTIFPNPTVNSITIQFDNLKNSTGELMIYDASGRVVRVDKLSNENSSLNQTIIDLSGIENGIYYCNLVSENFSHTKSFVISR